MTLRNGPTPRANLICSHVFRGRKCDQATSIRYRAFEDAALTQMLHLALDDRFFTKADETRPLVTKVAELDKLIADQTAKSKRLLKMILGADDPDQTMLDMRSEIERTMIATKARREDAILALDAARGAVSQAAHMRRVWEVREAINHEDESISTAARMKVAQAIQTVVERVEIDTKDEFDGKVQKTFTMTLVGNVRGFKFDDRGNLLAEFDLGAHILNPETGVGYLHGSLGVQPDPQKIATLHEYFRRRGEAA